MSPLFYSEYIMLFLTSKFGIAKQCGVFDKGSNCWAKKRY